ncbi:hypothetical protein LCGC14_0903460, partial [marine sediment metagenome]
MGLTPGTETVISLARRVKEKYPRYREIGDFDLVRRIVEKYPQYRQTLNEASQRSVESKIPQAQIKAPVPGLTAKLQRAYGAVLEKAQRGTTREMAEFAAGPFLGPIRLATGISRVFDDPQKRPLGRRALAGGAEIIGGAMQTIGPFGTAITRGALPAYIPPFELASRAAGAMAEKAELSPEAVEFARVAVPLAGIAAGGGLRALRLRGTRAREIEAAKPRAAPRLAPAPGRRALPPVRGPEIGIERELPAGGVMRPVPPPTTPPGPDLVLGEQARLAPAPGLKRVGKGRVSAKQQMAAAEKARIEAVWKRVLEEEAPPPPAPVAKPLPKGVTEELVQAELSAMNRRGQEFRQP